MCGAGGQNVCVCVRESESGRRGGGWVNESLQCCPVAVFLCACLSVYERKMEGGGEGEREEERTRESVCER